MKRTEAMKEFVRSLLNQLSCEATGVAHDRRARNSSGGNGYRGSRSGRQRRLSPSCPRNAPHPASPSRCRSSRTRAEPRGGSDHRAFGHPGRILPRQQGRVPRIPGAILRGEARGGGRSAAGGGEVSGDAANAERKGEREATPRSGAANLRSAARGRGSGGRFASARD